MKKKLAVLIPKGIDIDEIVKNSSLPLSSDYLKYIISSVILTQGKWIDDYEIRENKKTGKKAINSYVKVKNLITRKHKLHADFLVGNNIEIRKSRTRTKYVNILDRDRYVKGAKTYCYRLSNSYCVGKPLTVQYITDSKIINLMLEEETVIHPIVKSGKFKFLKKFFDSDKLKINLEEAVALCEDRYKEHQNYNKYVKELTQVLNIYNGIYRISFKEHSIERLYSNITQLPKVYREFITYDDKRLAEVDISNSVIYFLGILLKDYTLIGNTINNNTYIDNTILNNINGGIYSNLLMIYKSFESLCNKEIELIHSLGISGGFYDIFILDFERSFTFKKLKYYYEKEFEDEYLETEKQKRKITKKLIIAMLFADSNQYKNIQDIFKLKFPQFLELLNRFKDEHGYKLFSHILFQIEAYYVINVVARQFNQKHSKKAPVFTLHDCLITTFDYKDELEYTLKENLSNMLEYTPKTESKFW